MNFQPELSTGAAVFLALLAAFMWGTWFISLKYLGDYPLDGYFITLFFTSFVFVWSVGFLIDGSALLGNIRDVLNTDSIRVTATFVCGGIYVTGMRFQITVFSRIGLSLAQPIQSAIATMVSLVITVVVGGLPATVSIERLVLATFILIGAVLVSMQAGRIRTRAQATHPNAGMRVSMQDIYQSLWLILLASLLSTAYPFALSFGLQSTTQPNGMAVLPFMAVLASGAFLGSLLNSGIPLTRKKQWHRVWSAGFRIHKFGIWSGLFHYGGNIIHTFAASDLSAAIAFPLGITSGLWTQMWGLVYGEFRGSPRSAYLALFAGVALYILGALLIVSTLQ
jgi:drug/metabolite transporter (DMT)-like permease